MIINFDTCNQKIKLSCITELTMLLSIERYMYYDKIIKVSFQVFAIRITSKISDRIMN